MSVIDLEAGGQPAGQPPQQGAAPDPVAALRAEWTPAGAEAPSIDIAIEKHQALLAELGARETKLREEWEAKRYEARPATADGYKLPEIEGVMPDALAQDELTVWWREQAFSQGLGQEQFDAGIQKYLGRVRQLMEGDPEQIHAELGANGKVRCDLVGQWCSANLDKEDAKALVAVVNNAGAVRALEAMIAKAAAGGGGLPSGSGPTATFATLQEAKEAMKDPRYWNPKVRDMSFCDKVTATFQRKVPEVPTA